MHSRGFVRLVPLVLVGASALGAQQLRGTVRDSVSRRALAGVVVMLQDSGAERTTRTITNAQGDFSIHVAPSVKRIRLVRLGFRPREVAISGSTDSVIRLDLSMLPLPTLLEPVQTRAAAKCPRSSDGEAALALLEQARAGLLSTIVAREASPASLLRLKFARVMEGTSDRIARQEVRMESTPPVTSSFEVVRSAADFAQLGFTADSGVKRRFFGVDAEVLVDSRFADSYCFRIHRPEPDRPNQIGLSFASPRRPPARVDIDGTLWIDTVARALRDIEYRYVGLVRALDAERPGGRTFFREMPNGVVLIDRWLLRAVFSQIDTVQGDEATIRQRQIRTRVSVVETGGELAEATWPDGVSWRASLGKLIVHMADPSRRLLMGTTVRLVGTDYTATIDSTGGFEISNLVSGSYSLSIVDPRLQPVGIDVPTSFKFMAARDSIVERTVNLPTAEDFVAERCLAARNYDVAAHAYLFGRVTMPDGKPVEDAIVSVLRDFGGGDWQPILTRMRTDANGFFQFCTAALQPGETVAVHAISGIAAPAEAKQTLDGGLSVVHVVITPGSVRPH
jgi:hypothetical protein